jgi:hypothetical protein
MRRFARRDGLFRRSGRLHRPRAAEHLWPAARALVATLDLAGAATSPAAREAAFETVPRQLRAMQRYWDPTGPRPAFASDVLRTPWGTDRFYDDNAWVGLALVQLERLRSGSATLERAGQLWRFAQAGWDEREAAPGPGGVFWVQQGRGTGRRNHDRNTVSTAPNAELALHLRELTGQTTVTSSDPSPERMYEWVRTNLLCQSGPDTSLYWDKIRGDGSVDRTLWTYNQGNMVGLGVLLHRCHGEQRYLIDAQDTARAALARYRGHYFQQPPAFNAIFFRNLLLLRAASADDELRHEIGEALQAYADAAWARHRDGDDLFRPFKNTVSLLDQSALVSVLALPAWVPARYSQLA